MSSSKTPAATLGRIESREVVCYSSVVDSTQYSPDEPRLFGIYAGLGSVSDEFDSLSDEELNLFEEHNYVEIKELPNHG